MEMKKRSIVTVLIGVVLTGAVFGQNPKKPAGTTAGARGAYLLRQCQRFSKHNTAFLDFAHGQIERELAMEFAGVANAGYTCASAVSVLFSIYDQLSCRADRDMAWPIIKAELGSQATQLDISAKAANHNLVTYVKNPAVAAAAKLMNEDIAELKAFLEKSQKEE